jgi:hypothetical protein
MPSWKLKIADAERPYNLESSTNPAMSSWVSASPTPIIAGTNNVVTNTILGAKKYYRLISP